MRRALVWTGLMMAAGCARGDDVQRQWEGTMETSDGRTRTWSAAIDEVSAMGRIVEELRIGAVQGGGPSVFGRIGDMAVSSAGEIAVLDQQAVEVRVFDEDGAHLRTFGRSGSGPGEFQNPVSVYYDDHDRLWVVDPGNQRYHVFDQDGEYVRATRRAGGILIGDNPGKFTAMGLLDPVPHVAPGGQLQRLWILVDTSGATVDTLPPVAQGNLDLLRGVPGALAPFMSRTLSTPDIYGDLWIASTGQYIMYRRTSAGDTVLVAELEMPSSGLSSAQQDSIDAIVDRWPQSIDRERLGLGPQYIHDLHTDDQGRVFVEPVFPEQQDLNVIDAFDDQGRLLGRLVSEFPLTGRLVIEGDVVYSATVDGLDVPYVVRARIEWPNPGE